MAKKELEPVIQQVMTEQNQGHETRKKIFVELEKELKRPVVSFFTSFRFPVMIEDTDADMLEGVLQKMDLSDGLVLFINSPGGSGLAAERIINVCRSYSKTDDYWTIIPSKAKSAATMICFGASKIIMGATSELGPIDPQLTTSEKDAIKRFSAYNVVKSYEDLFSRAVEEKGNLQPYLQQLANYDEREIKEFKAALSLSEDIAIRTLASGMMKDMSEEDIRKNIMIFLTPEHTKTHGRPIYRDGALDCGLKIELKDVNDEFWKLVYELYIRTNNLVSTKAAKCIESKNHSFIATVKVKKNE
ncbi:MAG: Serine dehydrogenase proteinase [Candidatus Argoarchaeum ethanivorans]|uniref:Serine dehydrogenase proteinase n=1 Tax=Candidatus Argoarchaeum ethanivorans TaxID=2608793 RepID=A0A811T4Z1_9EURY|nr:MAG: Serine dehydrogenase proteinase [Candidatus Argoarchaeum ethanivorans]